MTYKVVIEVAGGVAYVTQCPPEVEVEIKDYDNLDKQCQKCSCLLVLSILLQVLYLQFFGIWCDVNHLTIPCIFPQFVVKLY